MRVGISTRSLKRTRWFEFPLRFAVGGGVCVLTGLIGDVCGPVIGGLFLAFPAIFVASVTLIQTHEVRKKRAVGLDGLTRGRRAAALQATGTVVGTPALALFALLVFLLIERGVLTSLLVAALGWFVAVFAMWMVFLAIRSRARLQRGRERPALRRERR